MSAVHDIFERTGERGAFQALSCSVHWKSVAKKRHEKNEHEQKDDHIKRRHV